MTIIIFSPQRWNELYISKHHYAMELAKNNDVWFISEPEAGIGNTYSIYQPVEGLSLKVLRYKVLLPDIIKFKAPALYKKTVIKRLKQLIKKLIRKTNVCIDFGSYQIFDDLRFIEAEQKVYFPVDDTGDSLPSGRGAHKVCSVSMNIVEKFNRQGLNCSFINHGVAEVFAQAAKQRLESMDFKNHYNGKLKFGYSGNLLLRFIDIPVLKDIITAHPQVEFHFFGTAQGNITSNETKEWIEFLKAAANVKLPGFLQPPQLAKAYQEMDGFLLCYKPDYKTYHAENSHKLLEYMSTGKVVVSTYLSLYEGNELINMSPKDSNELLVDVFNETVKSIVEYNKEELQERRIQLALENTYEQQIKKLGLLS